MIKPTTLFEMVLNSAGADHDENGLVSMRMIDEEPMPWKIGGKRLAIPYKELLREGAFNEDGQLIAFQPFSENVVLDTSPVLESLNNAFLHRLTTVTKELIIQLSAVAADKEKHPKMKMNAQKVLSAMPDADETMAKSFAKIMQASSTVGKNQLLSLFVRSSGTYGGEKVHRLGKFFPRVAGELDDGGHEIFGVTLRKKKDVPMFKALLEYLFPGYEDPDTYSAPSNSPVAPTFHALLKCFAKVAAQLNKIVDIHARHLNNPDSLRIDIDWREAVESLEPYRDLLPVLPGNDGKEGIKTQRVRAEKSTAAAHTAAAAAPAPVRKEGGVSVTDFLGGIRQSTQPAAASGWGQPANAGGLQPMGFRAQQQELIRRQRELEQLPDWARPEQDNSRFQSNTGSGWGRDNGSISRGGGRVFGGGGSSRGGWGGGSSL